MVCCFFYKKMNTREGWLTDDRKEKLRRLFASDGKDQSIVVDPVFTNRDDDVEVRDPLICGTMDEVFVENAIRTCNLKQLHRRKFWMHRLEVPPVRRGEARFTPLGYACALGRPLVVKHFLSLGVSKIHNACVYRPNGNPRHEVTLDPIGCAVFFGNLDIVQILWDSNHDPIEQIKDLLCNLFHYRVDLSDKTYECMTWLWDILQRRANL
jgi:hypothetical protein